MDLYNNMNLKKIFFIIFCLSCFFSCTKVREIGRKFPDMPNRKFLKVLAEASPEFQQGWHDGCITGMSGGANTFYKMFYQSNLVDGYKTTSSTEYSSAWGNAFWYCYRYTEIKHGSSIWGSWFSGYK